MGTIKSALEIALERTQDVRADKESLEANTYITEGKKTVSKFFSEENFELKNQLDKYQQKQRGWVRQGMFQALMANLKLPIDELAFKQSKRAGKGLFALVGDTKRLGKLMGQMEHFLEEFLGERKRVIGALEQQYAPRLKQKEEEMSRQVGARVKIDPMQDPEYLKLLRQSLALLEDRYNGVLAQVKQEIQRMFEEG